MKESVVVKKRGLFNKYQTIQQGVDAVVDGGTVFIEAGEYEESVKIVGKTVNLIARGHVILSRKINHTLISTSDSTVHIEGIEFVQYANANAVHIKEIAHVKLVNCTIRGLYQHGKDETKYPTVYIGLESHVDIEKCTITGETADGIYAEEAKLTLSDCEIKGSGIYINKSTEAQMEKIYIKHTGREGIFTLHSKLTIDGMKMVGGGVAVIAEKSEVSLKNIETNSTYRDVLRLLKSRVTIAGAKFKNYSEIMLKEKDKAYAGIRILDDSKVMIHDIEMEHGQFDAIEVNQSELRLSHARIANQMSGLYIDQSSNVYIDDTEISDTMYNAVIVKNQSSIHMNQSTFDNCGSNTQKHYPIVFGVEAAGIFIEDCQISNAKHDAVYVQKTEKLALEKTILDHVQVGVKSYESDVELKATTIKNCQHNGIAVHDSTIHIRESLLENNNIEYIAQYEEGTEVPVKLQASLHGEKSTIHIFDTNIYDKTAAISLVSGCIVEGENLQFAGGVFSNESQLDLQSVGFRNVEHEPVHFTILHGTNAKVKFEDRWKTMIVTRDMSSTFISNLLDKPRITVMHDFKNNQMQNPFEAKTETNDDVFRGPSEFKEKMQRLSKEITLYKIREAQGITIFPQWSMWWVYENSAHISDYFSQMVELLINQNMYTKDDVYILSEEKPVTTMKGGIVLVDEMNLLRNDFSLQKLLIEQLEQPDTKLVLVICGTMEEIETFKKINPAISEKIKDEVFFQTNESEMLSYLVEQKLITHQFIFDSTYLHEAIAQKLMMTDEPTDSLAHTIVQAIIQAQSNRLLNSDSSTLSKEQITTLLKEDLDHGITNLD